MTGCTISEVYLHVISLLSISLSLNHVYPPRSDPTIPFYDANPPSTPHPQRLNQLIRDSTSPHPKRRRQRQPLHLSIHQANRRVSLNKVMNDILSFDASLHHKGPCGRKCRLDEVLIPEVIGSLLDPHNSFER
jgi:hypothetical protein